MVDLDIFITSRVKRKIVVFFVTYPAIKMHSRGLAKLLKEEKYLYLFCKYEFFVLFGTSINSCESSRAK